MLPEGPFQVQFDIAAWADFCTNATIITLVINPEALVHVWDVGKRELVKQGKQNILP